jgi:hypothetical protein
VTDDPIGGAIRADAGDARAEVRAAGVICPSCDVNMADVPRDHRLVLDLGGVNWALGQKRPPAARCAVGTVADLTGASFETWQASVTVSLWDDLRAADEAAFAKLPGRSLA